MHRMFSTRIANSAKFLKMPLSTQALYFHLGLNADDDGIVEAFPVMRTCGAAEDDLKILVAKGYAIILNEDLVTFISDWRENNKIRADRKRDSIYKDLLLRVVPGADLVEPRARADTKKITGGKNGQPMDVQRTDNGLPKISEDKTREVNQIECNYHNDDAVKDVFALWNSNIMPLTPIIGEKLATLVQDYGEAIVSDAIIKAVQYGKRNFAYVAAVAKGIAAGSEKPQKEEMPY